MTTTEQGPVDAQVVVLVHGSMDRMAGFAKVSRRLSDRYRVVRYDRRGYGVAVDHPGPYAIGDHANDLVEVIAGRRVALVGHSMGGNVVLSVAQRRPDLVLAAVVYETPMSWTALWPHNSTSRTIGTTEQDPADTAEMFMRGMLGAQRWERLPEATRTARRAEGRALVGEMVSVRESAPWSAESISVPVVVGRGSLASAHHFEGMKQLAESLADASLVTLEGCHHMAHAAKPDQFVDELIRPVLERERR